MITLSVLIPTWKRPQMLKKCLSHLNNQEVSPDQVVIVTRDNDEESINIVNDFKEYLPIEHVFVNKPGVIYAENAGLKVINTDITSFLDDDAYVPKYWVKLIKEHFNNSEIIGVGGPDLIIRQVNDGYRKDVDTVGRITWYGNPIGNHHHRVSTIHEVEILKGVNMSFRSQLLPYLDTNLQSDITEGNGSFWELDICMQLKGKGKMIFDPSLEVEHDSDHSHFIPDKVIYNNSRNYTYVMLKNLNFIKKLIFITYVLLLGNTNSWGFLKFMQQLFKGNRDAVKHFKLSLKGFLKGYTVATSK
ncbi:MAG: glycosyltransferase [Bdellovibrionota bacterium]|nr:glycosyltransferase [Bdellovibrionota bacterium]